MYGVDYLLSKTFYWCAVTDSSCQLLQSLRELFPASLTTLGVLPLDRLLEVFQASPTIRQQQNQTQWATQHPTPHPVRGRPPAVIEITDAAPCSGKDQLLCHMLATSLLPPEHDNISIHGKGQAAVVLDLSNVFSVLQLQRIMYVHICSKVSASSSTLSEQDISSLILDCLTHLHIFRPHSTPSLLATLDSLPSYLLSKPCAHFSANRFLGLVAINDISAFLWQDRLDADDEVGLDFTNNVEKASNSPFLQRYRNLVMSLRRLQELFPCTIVATNWGLAPITSVGGQPALRPHLPPIWDSFCTVKIVVERDMVTKFRPGTSIEDASGEAAQRLKAVEKSAFSGWVNWWGSGGWREEVRVGVRRLEREKNFPFRFTEEKILVGGEVD